MTIIIDTHHTESIIPELLGIDDTIAVSRTQWGLNPGEIFHVPGHHFNLAFKGEVAIIKNIRHYGNYTFIQTDKGELTIKNKVETLVRVTPKSLSEIA
jgi:hypothetical protein